MRIRRRQHGMVVQGGDHIKTRLLSSERKSAATGEDVHKLHATRRPRNPLEPLFEIELLAMLQAEHV